MAEQGRQSVFDDERARRWLAQIDQLEAQLQPVSDALFAVAALQVGERVLDVGCGSGPTTRVARTAVGPTGAVTGIDLSAAMIDAARRRVGAETATWIVDDAAVHPFEAASFDAVISRFGVMFFADPVQAFANLGRATRAGGRLAIAVWGPRESVPLFQVPIAAAMRALDGIGVPYVEPPPDFGPFGFADRELVARVLAGAGWSDVTFQTDRRVLRIVPGGSTSDAVDATLQTGPTQLLLGEHPSARAVAAVRAALAEGLGEYNDGSGVALPSGFVLVTGRWG